jgi:hypothetical protein
MYEDVSQSNIEDEFDETRALTWNKRLKDFKPVEFYVPYVLNEELKFFIRNGEPVDLFGITDAAGFDLLGYQYESRHAAQDDYLRKQNEQLVRMLGTAYEHIDPEIQEEIAKANGFMVRDPGESAQSLRKYYAGFPKPHHGDDWMNENHKLAWNLDFTKQILPVYEAGHIERKQEIILRKFGRAGLTAEKKFIVNTRLILKHRASGIELMYHRKPVRAGARVDSVDQELYTTFIAKDGVVQQIDELPLEYPEGFDPSNRRVTSEILSQFNEIEIEEFRHPLIYDICNGDDIHNYRCFKTLVDNEASILCLRNM